MQFTLTPGPVGVVNPYAGVGPPPGCDAEAYASFLLIDSDRSNDVKPAELLEALRANFVFPPDHSPWDLSLAQLLVRVFDTSQPPKGGLHFGEYEALHLHIRETERFVRERAAARGLAEVPANWYVTAEEVDFVLSAFGVPATPDWADARLRVVLSVAGAAGRCSFPGLLRVMAEVKGLTRLCQLINVVPGANMGDPPQPRAITNQELVSFFCASSVPKGESARSWSNSQPP